MRQCAPRVARAVEGIISQLGPRSSEAEHPLGKGKVGGSIPPGGSIHLSAPPGTPLLPTIAECLHAEGGFGVRGSSPCGLPNTTCSQSYPWRDPRLFQTCGDEPTRLYTANLNPSSLPTPPPVHVFAVNVLPPQHQASRVRKPSSCRGGNPEPTRLYTANREPSSLLTPPPVHVFAVNVLPPQHQASRVRKPSSCRGGNPESTRLYTANRGPPAGTNPPASTPNPRLVGTNHMLASESGFRCIEIQTRTQFSFADGHDGHSAVEYESNRRAQSYIPIELPTRANGRSCESVQELSHAFPVGPEIHLPPIPTIAVSRHPRGRLRLRLHEGRSKHGG
jgi:hypothetical protein